MSDVAMAAADLESALKTSSVWSVYRDPGATLGLPAAILGPPALQWQAGCPGPTTARFLVYVVVDADERAVERLWDLVVEASDIIDTQTDAVVIRADPAVFPSGANQLPSYQIQVEVGL